MKHFKINTQHIIHEIFDDQEAVIINLITGNYYNLNKIGAKIWDGLEKNLPIQVIVDNLFHLYDADIDFITNVVEDFTSELQAEKLILPIMLDSISDRPADKFENPVLPKDPFVIPTLQRFGDAQELLLLDPIHNVTEAGFPHRRDENKV